MNAEVKAGYKRTEAGVIPDDWRSTTIGEVASFSGGAQPPRETFVVQPKSDHVRLIQIRDYKSDDFATYIHASLAKKTCTSEDVMIGRYGPPIFQILRGLDGAYNVALIKTIPSSVIDRNFWFYLLNSEPLFVHIELLSRRSSGQTGVDLPALKAYNISLPKIDEQKAIASALSDIDALINGLDHLIAKKRDIRQAVMLQLLTGQRRLPGFSGEWAVKRLDDYGRCLRGVSYKGDADLLPHDTDETYRLLRSNNVQNARVDINGLQFVKAACVSAQQAMRRDDILICMANGSKELVGKAAIFDISDGFPYTFGAFMGCFRANPNAVPRFIYFLLNSGRYRSYIANLLAGSSINNLRPSNVEQMEFPFPSTEEQTAIATVLSDMDTELAALETRRDKARQLKQGMMQELLTGRIRLV